MLEALEIARLKTRGAHTIISGVNASVQSHLVGSLEC